MSPTASPVGACIVLQGGGFFYRASPALRPPHPPRAIPAADGFNNLLFGWIDTIEDNYPGNLTSAAHEILVGIVEHVSGYIADGIWSAPFNKV
jgi:hypothetical protein